MAGKKLPALRGGFEVPVRAGYADRSKDEECQKSGIRLFRGSKHTI